MYYLMPLTVSLLFLSLGVFVFLKGRNSPVSRAFLVICITSWVWLFMSAIAYFVNDKVQSLFWMRISYVGIIFIPLSYYFFTMRFFKISYDMGKLAVFYLAIAFSLFFLYILWFTELLISEVRPFFWGYYPYVGKWHPAFMAFFIATFSYIFISIALYYRKNRDSLSCFEATRFKYWMLAFIVMIFATIDFIPNYGIAIYPFGSLFGLCFTTIVAYAIVRHQLMNIEIVIKKTLVFTGLLVSTFAILILPTLFIQEHLVRSAGAGTRVMGLVISGIIIIFSMRRIEGFLVNITDKYLFQKKYDYRELLRTFTSEVLMVINLDKLVNLTIDKLTDTVKVGSSAVLLLDQENQRFDIIASRNVKDPKVALVRPDGIVTFLEQTHGYLLKKELVERRVYIPLPIQEIIDKLNAELIIPMVLHSDVMGILSLGKKKSDEDYTQDDLDILLPLARTLAIAISNARLFSELGKAQAEAAQREKMAVIGTLSAGINHEICNPLGIARGQCEAFILNMKDGLYNDKSSEELLTKAKEIMTKVIKETDRATAITKKLSSFAKPAKGEAELVNMDKEIDDVFGLVGYELKLDKIEFEKQIEKSLPDMFVDKKQLQEVLFNLIRNAGQAIGERGKITVTARRDEGRVSIDIKDTGSGIPDDKLKELFNPFFTTKDPGKGTGLGLFIVRQIVEKNGGKIYLKETKVGGGTTFTVEFPVKASQGDRV